MVDSDGNKHEIEFEPAAEINVGLKYVENPRQPKYFHSPRFGWFFFGYSFE